MIIKNNENKNTIHSKVGSSFVLQLGHFNLYLIQSLAQFT